MDAFGLMQQLGVIPVHGAEPYGPEDGWTQPTRTRDVTADPERARAIARRHFEEVWAGANLSVADEIYAPQCVGHCGAFPDQHGYPESEKAVVERDRATFPDLTVAILDQIAEGDRVTTRWLATGTHLGGTQAPPTGNTVRFTGIHIHRLEGDKIVEVWALDDLLGLLQQMGVVPTPEHAH